MHERARQHGLSMTGFLFVAVVSVIFVMIGFRVAPAYLEAYSIEKALNQALLDVKDVNSTAEVRAAFQKRCDAGYIDSVSGADVELNKSKNEVTATVSWTRKLALVANASLLLDFEVNATR